jgi:hypothetical protein
LTALLWLGAEWCRRRRLPEDRQASLNPFVVHLMAEPKVLFD